MEINQNDVKELFFSSTAVFLRHIILTLGIMNDGVGDNGIPNHHLPSAFDQGKELGVAFIKGGVQSI